jgi:hypothetical protein
MAHCQITCINLSYGGSGHSHITHVGNPQAWSSRLTVAEAVRHIQHGINTFFVRDAQGREANVHVVDANPPYLRTVADGYYTDNLLSLTSCPLN